jgi:hypothetical protein
MKQNGKIAQARGHRLHSPLVTRYSDSDSIADLLSARLHVSCSE